MKAIMWIVIVLLIIGGVWWYFSMPTETPNVPVTFTTADITIPPTTSEDTTTPSTSSPSAQGSGGTQSGQAGAAMTATVMYGAQGFSPASVTIAKGGTVTWVNQGGSSMWVATAQHPSHVAYSGTTLQQHCPDTSNSAFDQCQPGDGYSFTFNKVGSWNYHNHSNVQHFGKVTVQ
ncbi:MAG: hypothetical protein Q8R25_02575 [bacterium]|nr:hypothetical protein [bacterium]